MGWILRNLHTTHRSHTGSSKVTHSQLKKGVAAPSCDWFVDCPKATTGWISRIVFVGNHVQTRSLSEKSFSFAKFVYNSHYWTSTTFSMKWQHLHFVVCNILLSVTSEFIVSLLMFIV